MPENLPPPPFQHQRQSTRAHPSRGGAAKLGVSSEAGQLRKLVSIAPRRPGPARISPRGFLCLQIALGHHEPARSNTTRFELAPAGGGSTPALAASWAPTPDRRR